MEKKLYYGGPVLTMKAENDYAEALVTENGRIAYVGSLEKANELCDESTCKVNLQGHTLMPAFIDAHSHFVQTAQSIKMCDLSDTESFEDIVTALKNYLEKNQIDENGMIFATGYDHNFLAEQSIQNRANLHFPRLRSYGNCQFGAAKACGNYDRNQRPGGRKIRQE